MSVTVQNTGSGPLNFKSIVIGGAAPGDFSVATGTSTCGQQLSPQASCIVNVVFTPTAMNSRIASLTFSDDAASSPQTVTLSGNGSAGAGVIALTATTVAFGNQQLNTTSAIQSVTLSNSSSASALSLTNMVIAGANANDFAFVSNCPASVAAGANCLIQFAFQPSTLAAESATLTITGSASNSPQNITLTGTGISGPTGAVDFSLTPNSTGVSVVEGGTAVFNFSVAPLNNFTDSITFTCSGPSGSTCTVPGKLTMDGTTIPVVKFSVNTSGGSGGSAKSLVPRFTPRSIFLAVLPFSMMGMLLINKRRGFWLVFTLLGLCLLMGLAGCGASSSSTSNSNGSGLAAGTYQVVFTGTSNGTTPITHSVTLNLVVTKQ